MMANNEVVDDNVVNVRVINEKVISEKIKTITPFKGKNNSIVRCNIIPYPERAFRIGPGE